MQFYEEMNNRKCFLGFGSTGHILFFISAKENILQKILDFRVKYLSQLAETAQSGWVKLNSEDIGEGEE